MEVLTPSARKTSTCPTTFTTPDLTTFARLDELGLIAVGQRVEPGRAVLACRVSEPDE
jgi:DNA-directed RNA polymerase beta subunit